MNVYVNHFIKRRIDCVHRLQWIKRKVKEKILLKAYSVNKCHEMEQNMTIKETKSRKRLPYHFGLRKLGFMVSRVYQKVWCTSDR